MGVGKKTARKRAVGMREHIIAYLTEVNELFDANGMASTQLAAAVGYPGSSVAFAQLLSGMERSGLIEREVRGKRTYRIRLGPVHVMGRAGTFGVFDGSGGSGATDGSGLAEGSRLGEVSGITEGPGIAEGPGLTEGSGTGEASSVGSGIGAAGFDYDELARRLLVHVVRRLAAAEPEASHPDRSELQETVTGLEAELATAWTEHAKLAEENVRLREHLRAAQRSLALAADRLRRLPTSSDLDSSEVVLLQRLLTEQGAGRPDDSAQENRDGLEQARSVLS